MNIFDELTSFFRQLNAGQQPISIIAGVSGGADSTALIHLLHECREQLGIGRLAVAHVNHGLRGEESDGDEEFVRGIAERLQIAFFRVKLEYDEENDGGMEDWARRQRYDFFHQTAKDSQFDYIATAHTANDQAETVLLRLARGTGVRGLRGILPAREDGVIRPLINIERRELLEWLGGRGLPYRTDSSNADDKYRRNYIRNRVMPLLTEVNPGAIANIASCAASAARAWGIIAGRVDGWVNSHVLRINDGAFHVEKAGFAGGDIASEALLALFEDYGIPPSKHHIARVTDAVCRSSGEYLLPDGWKFYPRGDRICFVRE